MTISSRSKNGTLELRKRVPRKYAAVEPRAVIWLSLGTDSKSTATAIADNVWRQQVARWEALLAGDTTEAEERHVAARQLVEAKGFGYEQAATLLESPIDKLLPRLEAVSRVKGRPSVQEARALLGMVPSPGLKVSKALELFWELTSSELLGKSQDQIRRTKNPVTKAFRNFIEVVGDKELADINRNEMLDFRQWWSEQLEVEELTANSANKDLGHLGKVLKRVNELKRLQIDLPLGGLNFKNGDPERRPPFSEKWIREKLLAKGALSGMNVKARCILLGMINTGYRPSEGAALLPSHINLEADVPHISILPEGRELKTKTSKRILPLAGVFSHQGREQPKRTFQAVPLRVKTSCPQHNVSFSMCYPRSCHCGRSARTERSRRSNALFSMTISERSALRDARSSSSRVSIWAIRCLITDRL